MHALQIGVIPARFQSVRFPGKPLVSILGKPMVLRTWEQACKATTLQKVVVATDDERIASVCRNAGAEVVMTSSECPNGAPLPHVVGSGRAACWVSGICRLPLRIQVKLLNAGTVRCHEAVTKLPGEYDVVINIQGDEPLIEPEIIDDTVRALQNSPDCVYRSAHVCRCATFVQILGKRHLCITILPVICSLQT